MSTMTGGATIDNGGEVEEVGALLKTWSPDDFRRFAHFVCGYAPEVVREWHRKCVEPKEVGHA